MKRAIALVMCLVLLLSGCGGNKADTEKALETDVVQNAIDGESDVEEGSELSEITFSDLDDPNLTSYLEDAIYCDLVSSLGDDKYFIENIDAVYISKEYLEEIAYNTQANIFFGYTLAELNEVFEGERYVFSLAEDGTTTVEVFQEYDDTYEKVLKNVVIGTGVILVCVTVSVITGGAGAPAVSMIFAASAKTGTVMALSSGTMSAVATGIVTGVETGDMESALKASVLAGSESFKWGAITGSITGGTSESVKYVKVMKALKGQELVGLTMQEAAAVQMETGYPVEIIKQFHNMNEVNAFKAANLKAVMVNGKLALGRKDIDLDLIDEDGLTNYQRMLSGKAPLDVDGNTFELHHVGQKADGTLAIFTRAEHDNPDLHGFIAKSEIDRDAFATQRKNFWKAMANILKAEVL